MGYTRKTVDEYRIDGRFFYHGRWFWECIASSDTLEEAQMMKKKYLDDTKNVHDYSQVSRRLRITKHRVWRNK